jgi:hypothetical protein
VYIFPQLKYTDTVTKKDCVQRAPQYTVCEIRTIIAWPKGEKIKTQTEKILYIFPQFDFWTLLILGIGEKISVLRIRIWDLGSGAFLTPGSGIQNLEKIFSGSRIPNPYFWELSDNFLGKKFYTSLKIGPTFFFNIPKIK